MIGTRVWGLGFSLIKILVVMFLFLYPIPYTLYPSFAADSTPSADIKSKLEEFKKEIASKAAKLKQEVNRKLQNKAYIGNLKTKSDTSLTIASDKGPKIVTINQDTIYESKIKTKIKFSLKTLAVEDYIASLGDIDDNGVLTAKKIILLPTTNYQLLTFLWGQVISISDRLITIKNRDLKNIAVSISNKTDIKKGEDEASLGNLKTNDFIVVTGSLGKNEIFSSRFIYIIPQGGIIKPKSKVATPSAQKATTSATPKSSKR